MRWIRPLSEVGLQDVALVGGKNASLGEMLQHLTPLGVRVPDGFVVTTDAWRLLLGQGGLSEALRQTLAGRKRGDNKDLLERSSRIRELLLSAPLPPALEAEILLAYSTLSSKYGEEGTDVAVRSSATAEDLPTASFAGQLESFLNVRGRTELLTAVRKSFASLFTPRAISYREDTGFDHSRVALSVGVQKMVRADKGSAGVIFTLDPDTGHRGMVLVTSCWGLGETLVQGRVAPDQFWVHKGTLEQGFASLCWRRPGDKDIRIVYDEVGHRGVREERVPEPERLRLSLSDADVLTLARWSLDIEKHYSQQRGADTPVDIEFARDGLTGELFIVQARPETVFSQRKPMLRMDSLQERGPVLARGLPIGERIATGTAHVVKDPRMIAEFQPGEVLVTGATDPDWEPIMKRAAGIVTERGGRTSHAAIIARELGIPAIVGTGDATLKVPSGTPVTLSCAEGEGVVYSGKLRFSVEELDAGALQRPRTQILLNVANPERALHESLLPSDGVGLARMEFIFASWLRVHPMALLHYDTLAPAVQTAVDAATGGCADKAAYFVDKLAEGIAMLAAAFWPRPVILRFSDFKTNEYAKLVGGATFEPHEENPMLGWRGASRYAHPGYREGFQLEVAAVRRVREVLGLKNLKVMVPFCRTPTEGESVLEVMSECGLVRGQDGLEVYVMAEIPSNILLAADFSRIFDGFSIGSNDLTQLILGVDRDSETVAPLFDERNPAVLWACVHLLDVAHRSGRKVGICGQAPSDYPEFAAFLVEHGIDSISLNADAVVRTTLRVLEAEQALRDRGTAAQGKREATWSGTPS